MVKQLVERSCVYCGSKKDLTRDHIPPKCIFAEPRPTNLISVPACESCNTSFKLDDEFFRIFVTAESAQDNPAARRIWEEAVMQRSLKRSPRLKAKLRSSLGKVDLYSPGGIFLGEASTLRFSKERINPVLERIVRGLYWRHRGSRIDPNAEFLFYKNPEIEDPMIHVFRSFRWTRIGSHDEFWYGFGIAPSHIASIWIFIFFGRTTIIGTVAPRVWPDG